VTAVGLPNNIGRIKLIDKGFLVEMACASQNHGNGMGWFFRFGPCRIRISISKPLVHIELHKSRKAGVWGYLPSPAAEKLFL